MASGKMVSGRMVSPDRVVYRPIGNSDVTYRIFGSAFGFRLKILAGRSGGSWSCRKMVKVDRSILTCGKRLPLTLRRWRWRCHSASFEWMPGSESSRATPLPSP